MDDPLSWLYLVLIILLLVFSSFFSSSETAFSCLNQYKMRVKADEGSKAAKLVVKIYDKFDRSLIASLIGNNIVAVVASTLATLLFVDLFNVFNIGSEVASIVSTVVISIVFYLIGDTIPKLIGRAKPDRVALNNVYIFLGFYYLFYPFVIILSGVTWLVNKIFRADKKPQLTEEDFTNIVESIEDKGIIDESDSEIIYNSMDFSDTQVYEVLTKRENMFCIDLKNTPKEKINEIILSTNYSRIPVCYGSIDKIVGILHVKNYIRAYLKNPKLEILSTLQKPYIVSPKINIDDMVEGFKKHKTHIAIVMYNNHVVGMLTMEDVLEELFGDIHEGELKKKGTVAK